MQDKQIKLDYSIESPQQRTKLVKQIVQSASPERLTPHYLEILANYMIFAMTKEEKKNKKINTSNRMVTINKRETSFQGLSTKFENGEDGIYNIIIENDKNIIFTPKIQITEQDINNIPFLRELREAIDVVQAQQKKARGRRKYFLKKQLIEMRQDQYIIKNAYNQPIYSFNAVKNFNSLNIDEKITIKNNDVEDQSLISLTNPKHISALLCNYSKLKEDSYGKIYTDGYYLIWDLENLIESSLKIKHPYLYDLLIFKIDGRLNPQIQQLLEEKHGYKYSVEYISYLWRNKIPKLIADAAKKEYITWYYTTKEKGKWKKCSRCGEVKLAHSYFYSKNNSSKDGFYSICKKCRNEKKKKVEPVIIKRILLTEQRKEGGEENSTKNM